MNKVYGLVAVFKEIAIALYISRHVYKHHLRKGFGGLLMWCQPVYRWTVCHHVGWEHYYRSILKQGTSH